MVPKELCHFICHVFHFGNEMFPTMNINYLYSIRQHICAVQLTLGLCLIPKEHCCFSFHVFHLRNKNVS